MGIARSFNKVNGFEIGKIAKADFDRAIDVDEAFRQHQTYLEFEYDVTMVCRFVTGPGEAPQEVAVRVNGGRTLVEMVDGKPVSAVPADAPRGVLEVTRSRRHSAVSDPPDRLRKDTGLHVPKAQVAASGEIVEVPMSEIDRERTLRARRAAEQRDREVAEKGLAPLDVGPVQDVRELARDVTEASSVEMRRDLAHVELEKTTIPVEHVQAE